MKQRKNNQGWMMYETAILLSISLPLILTMFGILDYTYSVMTVRRVVAESFQEINTPTINIGTGDQGFFTRARAGALRSVVDNMSTSMHNKFVSSLGLDPVDDKDLYSLEVGFVYFHIDQITGQVIDLASWGDNTSPTGNGHYKAFYEVCFGMYGNGPGDDNAPCNNNDLDADPLTLSNLGKKFSEAKNQSTAGTSDAPMWSNAMPTTFLGSRRQAYFGPTHEYASTSTTIDPYVRHSVLLGVTAVVDLQSTFGGKLLKAMGLSTQISEKRVATPRQFF